MKIEIPDEIAKRIGIVNLDPSDIEIEVTDLAYRIPTSVTGSKNTEGVVIYAKED